MLKLHKKSLWIGLMSILVISCLCLMILLWLKGHLGDQGCPESRRIKIWE